MSSRSSSKSAANPIEENHGVKRRPYTTAIGKSSLGPLSYQFSSTKGYLRFSATSHCRLKECSDCSFWIG